MLVLPAVCSLGERMISHSGKKYSLYEGTPTLRDIAIALGRLPRWCGATQVFWPVLAHTMVVADLLKAYGPRLELAGLTHDVDEACGWGDISKQLKGTLTKRNQREMRIRFGHEVLGVDLTREWDDEWLHQCDALAADAERQAFLDGGGTHPPAFVLAATLRQKDKHLSYEYIDSFGRPVEDWIERVERLVKEIKAVEHCHSKDKGVYAGKLDPRPSHSDVVGNRIPGERADRLLALREQPRRHVREQLFPAAKKHGAGNGVAFESRCLADQPEPEGSGVGGVRGGAQQGWFHNLLVCSVCGVEYGANTYHKCDPDGFTL